MTASLFKMPSKASSQAPSDPKTLIAINGFLGRTGDWPPNLVPLGWDFKALPVEDISDFETWAERFNEHIRKIEGKRVLLGYSMGGRLAMHAVLKEPSLYSGAIFISANPGLLTDEERRLRIMTDELWAKKILSEQWDQLMTEWDHQVTLRPPKNPAPDFIQLQRPEAEYSRAELAQTLRLFSLGLQRDLRRELASLRLPIEFITGDEDLKFTALTRTLSEQTGQPHRVIANAGHRVPWDAPAQTRKVLADFLRTV